ncbi:MAG: amidinotransferase [Candidatus Saccharimonadales bacterium]
MSPTINRTVLMSGVDYFDDQQAINPFMNKAVVIDRDAAKREHTLIKEALQETGVKVIQISAPKDCQDGVYTANWGLVRGNKAVMSRLPNARKGEEPYAAEVLRDLGKEVIVLPDNFKKFSGQGDSLPCGNYLFAGSSYRSDPDAQAFVAKTLGYELIQLRAIPFRSFFGYHNNRFGWPAINQSSGWRDSFYYDIDLALSVLKGPTETTKGLIAWCPAAFTPKSRRKIRSLTDVDKIEVSAQEATKAFACNLVSTGTHVIMNAGATNFASALKKHGLKPILLSNPELGKGGGSIRCTTLTLDNV